MNREPFGNGEYYHIYNRGTDKREIFNTDYDVGRFLKSMELFNSVEPTGSLWLMTKLEKEIEKKPKKLVDIVAFCLNPNHYHLILKQRVSKGIPEFMRRVNGGYTLYFNLQTKRSGYLFQGTFKSKWIGDNDYLLHLSAYVNLNDKVHQLRSGTAQLVRSSWEEYTNGIRNICNTDIILKQFHNLKEYKSFALDALPRMLKRKKDEKELASLLLE